MRTVIVAAGILLENGRVLLSQRKAGAHLAGMWEFPGGKVEPGEDPKSALQRELSEELGIDVDIGDILDVAFHRYEEAQKAVLLLFYRATRRPGSPMPVARDVAAFQWGDRAALDPTHFPPADVGVLEKVAGLL
jgi:8-oxo-dGTP diphosphatase